MKILFLISYLILLSYVIGLEREPQKKILMVPIFGDSHLRSDVYVAKYLSENNYNVTIILPEGSRFLKIIENTTINTFFLPEMT
jgi:predicted CoA-binding protein